MHKLDAKDKKLLYAIDLNARLGTSKLGKKIHLSQEGTFYRLQRLEKKAITSKYITLINFSKLGYTGYGVYARFQNVDKKKREEIIIKLMQNNHIYWIGSFGGKYDLCFALMAKNIIHFNEMFSEISTSYNSVLKDFTVAIRIGLSQFPRDYLINKSGISKRSPKFGKLIQAETIDPLDHLILKEIATMARMPVLEIAKRINKPASTVMCRIKDLEKREIIQGYSTQIHCQAYGYQSYQLFLNTHNLTKEAKRRLFFYCKTHPNIIFHIETVGKWNFEIIYEIKDQKELQNLIIDLRTKFSKIITDVESIVLFNHYVKYNQYPLLK